MKKLSLRERAINRLSESKSVKESIMFRQGDLLEWEDLMGVLEDGKSIEVTFGFGEHGTSFESSRRSKYVIVQQRYGITIELDNECIVTIMFGDVVKIKKAKSDFLYHIEIEEELSLYLDISPSTY